MRRFWTLCSILLLSACGGSETSPDGGRPGTDSGVPSPDSGRPRVDGGSSDGGSSPDDGGSPSTDGGTPTDGGTSPSTPPDVMGPRTVTTTMGSVMRGSRTTPVVAHVPSGTGTFPLLVFAPGFQVESRRYAPLCDRLASHGFVVVRADADDGNPFIPGSTSHLEMRDDLVAVIGWATSSAPFAASVDASRIGVLGHSLGGKLSTMVTAADARVRALLGIDPVDGGGGPLGPSPATPDIVPSQSAGITVPVGFIGETVNGTASGGPFAMACAPLAENFQQFYASTTMASWAAEWDIANADHMDFVWDKAGCMTCGLCMPAGTADENAVRAATATLAVAFFRRHLRGESSMEPYLTGPMVPAGITTRSR
jgi:hypothetical protein